MGFIDFYSFEWAYYRKQGKSEYVAFNTLLEMSIYKTYGMKYRNCRIKVINEAIVCYNLMNKFCNL